jgi:rhodanese-related sulfurtransferase
LKRLVTTLVAVGVGAAVPLLLAARQSGDEASEFRIELSEFQALHAGQAAYVIDVRNPQAYLDGHIEGAVSIPLDTIDGRVEALRLIERPIVTYCRCYEEATSLLAAQRLGRYGIEGARALVGGLDAWVAAGGAVATGEAEQANAPAEPAQANEDPGSSAEPPADPGY